MKNIKAFTHSGIFHADDVMSSAFLKLLNPEIKIERGFKVPDNYDGIVFDIGFGKFDHHQPDGEIRENGVPYAAFGKLWREFSPELALSKKSLDIIEETIVQSVDNTDNTGDHNPLSTVIGYFNPEWNSDEVADDDFEDAVEFALLALKKVIKHFKAVEEANMQAKEAIGKMTSNGIIVLDKFIPLSYFEEEENAKLVVFPSLRGGYNVNCIRGHFELPKEWRGISVEKAKELGLKGLTFCHVGGFILAAETKEDAIALAKKAIEIVNSIKKYELTDETIHDGKLHRIKALRSFGIVKAGDLGGFIESEDNLSHERDCWIFDNAIVKDEAKVFDNAKICGNAIVRGNANIYNKAIVIAGIIEGSTINGDAVICKDICLQNNAYISSTDDYINITMNGITVTFYLSKDKDIYLTFGIDEYKLDNIIYVRNLSDNIAFPIMVELAKKYLLREKNMDCQEITDAVIKEIQETPLRQYLKETGINDNFFYEYKNCSRELTIFTKIPGVWIGLQGKGVDRLSEILNKQFGHEVDIQFKEMKGNFMSL